MKAAMKKLLAMGLVVTITAGLAITGTVAYLTDRDSEINVFTVGDVEIDLNEDFEQGATLLPGKDIEKKPTITNTGKNDAWVWATIAIPAKLDNDDASKNVIHFNYDKENVNDEEWTWKNAEGNWMVTKETINKVDYNVYSVLYQKALKANDVTSPVITKVYMDTNIDIAPNGDWHHVENGVVSEALWNTEEDGKPVIYVSAYAIQKEGFDTVQDAYAAYTAQWGDKGTEYAPITVATPTPGAVRPAGYAPAVNGEVIDGLTILDGSDEETNLRALYKDGMTGDLTVKNSVLDGTYAMNVTVAKNVTDADLTCEDTTFMGWTSYSGWATATFTGCTFKINSEGTYNVVRPYDTTTFTNCEFKGTALYLDKLAAGETITLEKCTYNGNEITDEILKTMVEEGSVASVTLK